MERKRALPPLKEPEKRQRQSEESSHPSLTLPSFHQLAQENQSWSSSGTVWLPPLNSLDSGNHESGGRVFPLPSFRGPTKPTPAEMERIGMAVEVESVPSTPPSAESSPDTSPANKSRKQKNKKEGLEETTVRVVKLLQAKGTMLFKDINQTLDIPYRRSSDILNVLVTTPLLCKEGKKRENKYPYVFGDGGAIAEGDTVNICHVMDDIEKEKQQIAQLQERIKQLQSAQD